MVPRDEPVTWTVMPFTVDTPPLAFEVVRVSCFGPGVKSRPNAGIRIWT